MKVLEKELNHTEVLTKIGDLDWALKGKRKLLDENEDDIRGIENMGCHKDGTDLLAWQE